MVAPKHFESFWADVEPILLPYEGGASQLYVLGLPLANLGNSIDTFCEHVSGAVVSTLNGFTYANQDAISCGADSKQLIVKAVERLNYSIISGYLSNNRSLNYWILPNDNGVTFDAEIVFWADEFFPPKMVKSEYPDSFRAVYALAEEFRSFHPNSECVLSASEVGNPRNERDMPWTLFW